MSSFESPATPHIQVLGFECSACRKTYARIAETAAGLGVTIRLEKVDDPRQFAAHGVLAPPGVVIDGRLTHLGGVPSRSQIAGWLGAKGRAGP